MPHSLTNMASYPCEILFNWKANKSPSVITSFSVADANSEDIYVENMSSEFQRDNLLLLERDEGNVGPNDKCVLRLSCPYQEVTSINGLTVISESRTLEISNDTDGYIATVRGKEINKLEDPPYDRSMLYLCKCPFKESYQNLTIKFLSLGDRTSFYLHSLVVNMSQHTENKSLSTRGTFDINKLKKDVDAMGDAVSDRARDLLTTMEQFKQNKLKNFEDFVAFQQNTKQQPLSSPVQDLSSIMSSMLQANALKSLLGDSHTGNQGTEDKGLNMYKMLQTVCGSVTSIRAATLSKEEQNMSAIDSSPDSVLDTSSHDTDDEKHTVQMDELMTFVEQKIHQVKSELQTELQEFRREVTLQISTATAEMNEKLDNIICMLKDVQRQKEESPPKSKTYQDYL